MLWPAGLCADLLPGMSGSQTNRGDPAGPQSLGLDFKFQSWGGGSPQDELLRVISLPSYRRGASAVG